jgi:fumarate hydratase class II
MKSSIVWPKKEFLCNCSCNKSKSKNDHYPNAISVSGVIRCSLILPQILSNKSKRTSHSKRISKGIIISRYLSFLKTTIDEIEKYEHIKDH